MENGLLGYEAIEDLDASGLAEINEVEYLPNVLEGDSFYDKAMALAKAGVIDADFSPYEYITDTELSAINNRFSGSEEKLSYTLKKNEDLRFSVLKLKLQQTSLQQATVILLRS